MQNNFPILQKPPVLHLLNSNLLSCLESPMDRGAWWAAVHGVAESQTRLNDFTFNFHFHALEKEMTIYSSVLAWRIPGTGEPGGLPPLGLQSQIRLKRPSSSSSSSNLTLGASLVAQMVKNPSAMKETWVRSLGREDPWRRKWQPTPVFSRGKSNGQRSLGATVHGIKKSQTQLSD